jgi:pyruvate/2-oxoglutarate dehydrogenase complex dihydrolipoamide dehydrogenase (E3) component
MGGDCLNTGCVPSKALLKSAKAAHNFRSSGMFGTVSQEPEIDFAAVKNHISAVIASIEPNDSQDRFEGLGVTVIRETAEFIDLNTVKAGGHEITARYFVIATGSKPIISPIEGLDEEDILTNESIFSLPEKPGHLIIIGGGPIGVEMAQAYGRLGCKVSLFDTGSILQKDDPELVDILRRSLIDEGIDVYEYTNISKVENSTINAEQNGRNFEVNGSHVLVAAGRKPDVRSLKLGNAAIELEGEAIKVDKRLRTSRKNIFAIGDVINGPRFTHVAGYHAGIVIRNIAFRTPARVDYKSLSWVTYTEPELANTGMSEKDAIRIYGKNKIDTVSWSFEENDRAQAEGRTKGMIKITVRNNGKILGASIVGPSAGELIGMWVLAINKGLKLSDVAGVTLPYPTLAEINKRVAGAWFSPKLFSDRTRFIVKSIQKLPL